MVGLTDWDGSTRSVRITGEFWLTRANWLVVCHSTVGVKTARAWTRIDALLIDARTIAWTIAVDDTFWTAIGRCADHIGQTSARGLIVDHLTGTVGTAR